MNDTARIEQLELELSALREAFFMLVNRTAQTAGAPLSRQNYRDILDRAGFNGLPDRKRT